MALKNFPRASVALATRYQSGATLIESMVALLIFSLGIIGLMGMQAVMIENSTQAKYRADASYLANQLIGQMWADLDNLASFASTSNATRSAWDAVVTSTLPAATTAVTIAGREAQVEITWKLPAATTPRRHVVVANINASLSP